MAAYRQGQDQPPTANDIATSAPTPAATPPPNFQSRFPAISSGMGRNRLYLMRHRLKTQPAAKCRPRKNRAIETASASMITGTSWPTRKLFSRGKLQQHAMAVIHFRGAGQNQTNSRTAAAEIVCQIQ